jgi:hypothetical protein
MGAIILPSLISLSQAASGRFGAGISNRCVASFGRLLPDTDRTPAHRLVSTRS